MSMGSSALFSGESYVAIGRETTLGTYSTCTTSLECMSNSVTIKKDTKILEQIERGRTFAKSISLAKIIDGSIEGVIYPDRTSTGYLLADAFGSSATSATATAETTGAGASSLMEHTFAVGSYAGTNKGLCMNIRKGDATNGKVFQYHGLRTSEFNINGELDEALKYSINFVGIDATQVSNDIEAGLTYTAEVPLTFVNGRFSVEGTFASLTSSSLWHVQAVRFGINNNLKTGNESRRLGSDILAVVPYGIQSYSLEVDVRFDTTTAYAAMIAGTEYAAEFEFLGSTYSGSNLARGLAIEFQKVKIKSVGDPELGGPDEVIQTTISFDVLRDESSTGYACKAILKNQMASI